MLKRVNTEHLIIVEAKYRFFTLCQFPLLFLGILLNILLTIQFLNCGLYCKQRHINIIMYLYVSAVNK